MEVKNMRFWKLIAVFFLAASLAACGGNAGRTESQGSGGGATPGQESKPAGKPESYKVGVNLELTGASSVWGVPQKNAIEMFVKNLNAKGGINGVPIELVVYDNESSETQSLVVTKKLVENDKVLAIIGGGTTPTTMSIVPYANQQKVPVVSVGSGDGISSPVSERPWIFKTPSNNADISKRIVEFLKARGKTNVAFMAMNNAYGESGQQTFEEVAKANGITIVAVEKFGATDKDMKPQLTNIKAKNPDAIIVWAIPPSASIVNRNYWELKMEPMLIYSAGAGSNALIELAGKEAAEGVYIASGKVWVADQIKDGDPQKDLITQYVKEYEAAYNTQASPIDGMAYDAILLVAKAIEMSGHQVTRESIKENLEKISGLVGITGIFNLSPENHQGLNESDIIMLQVQNGRWTIVE